MNFFTSCKIFQELEIWGSRPDGVSPDIYTYYQPFSAGFPVAASRLIPT